MCVYRWRNTRDPHNALEYGNTPRGNQGITCRVGNWTGFSPPPSNAMSKDPEIHWDTAAAAERSLPIGPVEASED